MRFFASPLVRRNALAFGLCVLAVLFALEAKTAWYGPANGPGVDIQSQKALPAELSAVVSQAPATFPPALVFLASIAAIAWRRSHFLPGDRVGSDPIPVSAAPHFFPGLFFRPPPAL
jgi:hypothetical protein